jgi:hypothetical protein
MIIDLSKTELELISESIDLWEKEPHSAGLSSMLMGAMFCPKEERDSLKDTVKKDMDKATLEANRRKRVAILLRAKLIQAEAKASEHEVTP